MAEVLKLSKTAATPVTEGPPGFVMTKTAREVSDALSFVERLSGPRLGMIAGASGVGVSTAVAAYAYGRGDVDVFPCVQSEGDTRSFAEAWCRSWDWNDKGNMSLPARRAAMLPRVRGRLTIFDNAHHLEPSAIEWALGVADQAGGNVAFCGGLSLRWTFIENDQLRGRMLMPCVFTAAKKGDVSAIVRAEGLARDGIPDALGGVSRFGGTLRNVFNVVELARVFAKGAPVGLADVNAAIEALQFGKGSK
ncbi:MAG: hypothetical protein ACK4S2_03635 [Gemmobacter sp.]|uniref:hypothetical protein n=1 Tax=Gemmobacter sp. TaxID=1898957 RepID=UPI0039197651